MKIKFCLRCGDRVVGNNAMFCTKLCRTIYKTMEVDTTPKCDRCDRLIDYPNDDWKGFCSKRCMLKRQYSIKGREQRAKHIKTPKERYNQYKKGAESRNLEFNITFDEFMTFWQKPCYYCGDPIASIGLDRTDNSKGYSMSNVVPCCTVCNFAKLARDKVQFIAHCIKIAKHQAKKNPSIQPIAPKLFK